MPSHVCDIQQSALPPEGATDHRPDDHWRRSRITVFVSHMARSKIVFYIGLYQGVAAGCRVTLNHMTNLS